MAALPPSRLRAAAASRSAAPGSQLLPAVVGRVPQRRFVPWQQPWLGTSRTETAASGVKRCGGAWRCAARVPVEGGELWLGHEKEEKSLIRVRKDEAELSRNGVVTEQFIICSTPKYRFQNKLCCSRILVNSWQIWMYADVIIKSCTSFQYAVENQKRNKDSAWLLKSFMQMYLKAVYSWNGTEQAEKSDRFVLVLKAFTPVSPRGTVTRAYTEHTWKPRFWWEEHCLWACFLEIRKRLVLVKKSGNWLAD